MFQLINLKVKLYLVLQKYVSLGCKSYFTFQHTVIVLGSKAQQLYLKTVAQLNLELGDPDQSQPLIKLSAIYDRLGQIVKTLNRHSETMPSAALIEMDLTLLFDLYISIMKLCNPDTRLQSIKCAWVFSTHVSYCGLLRELELFSQCVTHGSFVL